MDLYEQQTEPGQHSRLVTSLWVPIPGRGKDILLYPRTPTPALWTSWTLIQSAVAVLSQLRKSLGHSADHSCPSSARVKKEWSYMSAPPVYFHGMHKDNCNPFFFTGNNWASRPVMCAECQRFLLFKAHILLSHKTNSLHGLAIRHCHL
jgi:hypothetical protein